MSNEQIAHDLAIAKLYGSDLQKEQLIEKYREYYNEIYDCLKSSAKPSKIINSPF